jgi:hypothetical protein
MVSNAAGLVLLMRQLNRPWIVCMALVTVTLILCISEIVIIIWIHDQGAMTLNLKRVVMYACMPLKPTPGGTTLATANEAAKKNLGTIWVNTVSASREHD